MSVRRAGGGGLFADDCLDGILGKRSPATNGLEEETTEVKRGKPGDGKRSKEQWKGGTKSSYGTGAI
jgi:hypothetical protein